MPFALLAADLAAALFRAVQQLNRAGPRQLGGNCPLLAFFQRRPHPLVPVLRAAVTLLERTERQRQQTEGVGDGKTDGRAPPPGAQLADGAGELDPIEALELGPAPRAGWGQRAAIGTATERSAATRLDGRTCRSRKGTRGSPLTASGHGPCQRCAPPPSSTFQGGGGEPVAVLAVR